jgi:hypothetical protein
MAARGKGQNLPPYIEIDGQRFPLVVDGNGRAADIQRRPMVQFPGANQIGPNERPSKNPALSSITFFANTQRGMGTYKHAVLDGIDTFRRATLDTRFAGGITAPPEVETLTQCPLAANGGDWDNGRPVHALYVSASGIGTRLYFYDDSRNNCFTYNVLTDTWTVIPVGARTIFRWNQYVVLIHSVTGDIYTSANGTVFTQRDTSEWWGLASFGNRLWSFRVTDSKLYSCTNPTLAIGGGTGAWTAQSEEWYTGEIVTGLFTHRDRGGGPALYMVADNRIMGYDDESGEFEEFEDLGQYVGNTANTRQLLPFIWTRDKLLYVLPFSYGPPTTTKSTMRHLYQFTGNVDEVGPTERGGFVVADQFQRIDALGGNVHWLYAACSGDGANTRGEVIAMNDLGGWHTVYRPSGAVANPVRALCVIGGDIYVMYKDGTFQVIRDKDAINIPHLRYASGETETGEKDAYSGRTDCGLPNHEKIGASVYVAARKPDGLYGLPADNTLVIKYSLDGAAQVTLATLTSATTFPIELPLPENDAENQDGVVFRDIELYASLDPGATAGTIEEVTLFWSKWQEPRWAYQAVIDLREDTFRKFATSHAEHRGLGVVRDALETLVTTKALHRVKYGGAEWEVDLKAADLVMAGRESPTDGSGLYPITFRDVSADV